MSNERERILAAARLVAEVGGSPDAVIVEVPEDVMQRCLDAADLPGTPREVRAITLAYAAGIQRVLDMLNARRGP